MDGQNSTWTAAPMPDKGSLRFPVYGAWFDEREAPGESGGDGELTGPKSKEREAVEAARRSTDSGCRGGARARRNCGLAWAKSLRPGRIRRRRNLGRIFMGARYLGDTASRGTMAEANTGSVGGGGGVRVGHGGEEDALTSGTRMSARERKGNARCGSFGWAGPRAERGR